MKKDDENTTKGDITRREFMQYSAAAGAALAVPGLLSGCSSDGTTSSSSGKKFRTYYFDLSHADPNHNFYLKAARHYLKMGKIDSEALREARAANPMLSLVPDENITHYIKEVPLSDENICLCWIVGEDPSASDGAWNMPLMFYHLPKSALKTAAQWPGAAPEPGANKLRLYGGDPGPLAGDPDAYLWEDDFKNCQDQAVTLVFGHQELVCGQPDSAAHIQKNIIGPQPTTFELAVKLQQQGPATENGGWATQEVYINPDTGKPYLNSKGQKQYFPRWSEETLHSTGGAIQPSLQQAKNDPTLGVNITNLPVDKENPEMEGKIWKVRNGITTVDAGSSGLEEGYQYVFSNKSPEHGYWTKFMKVDSDMNVTFKVHNWYARYLGIYVRFLDANDNPIKVSDLPYSTTKAFPTWGVVFKQEYDNFALLLDAESEILGIPIKSTEEEFTFQWPEAASKALVLASGLGTGTNKYVALSDPGGVMTIVLNLTVPSIFLVSGAALGFAQWYAQEAGEENAVEWVKVIASLASEMVVDSALAAGYDDPGVLIEVAKTMGEFLLSNGGTWLISKIIAALTEAEVEDSIPIIGAVFNAIAALGLAAEIIQTSVEVAKSPKTYVSKLTFTHNIHVTIKHDPNDFEFPATATHYVLKAFFDNGTPWVSGRINMPGTSWSDPLHYTFSGVPYGGKVNISVGFYSQDGWQVGKGSTGNILNDDTAANVEITIKETKVPLTKDTVYSHKEKTVLDASGKLGWKAGDAPTATKVDLNCGNLNGDLCELACITVSEHFAAAGYAWRAFSAGVASCDSGANAQLFQFANMSIAQDPESGHKTNGCGFFNMVRIVYDLMGSQNNNFYLDSTGGKHLVRQIRLELNQKPEFDGPESNRCWGVFNAPSDAFLLHPSRKLISINSEYDKFEVLSLPEEAVLDKEAHSALVCSGTGTREGLISGPICGAIASDGAILILESKNKRIQAFDLGGNPAPRFGSKKDKYYVPLKEETYPVTYLDMAVEFVGYLYVLSYITQQGIYQYRLDIYTPEGDWLCRTTGMNASKLAVDYWRNAYTLNYEKLKYPDGTLPPVTEPSVSQWIPSTP